MRRTWLAAVAAMALVAPAQAADLRVGTSSDIVTLDPGNHRSRVTESALLNVYDALVARTDDMKLVPELAESVTQIDATTWEAKLRRGVRFHDGSEMTAEDVKFTYDRLTRTNAMDGKTSPRQSLVGPVAETMSSIPTRSGSSSPAPGRSSAPTSRSTRSSARPSSKRSRPTAWRRRRWGPVRSGSRNGVAAIR